jgi:histidine triad (HIT) family protein
MGHNKKQLVTRGDCLFCEIAQGGYPALRVWEDEAHIAILTPYPNTPGCTVVLTRDHQPSNICRLSSDLYLGLWLAAREVARLLELALDVRRCGLVAEGMGIDHAHVKLFPMHGIPEAQWAPVRSNTHRFWKSYPGFLSSEDGPPMMESTLNEIHQRILAYRGLGQ